MFPDCPHAPCLNISHFTSQGNDIFALDFFAQMKYCIRWSSVCGFHPLSFLKEKRRVVVKAGLKSSCLLYLNKQYYCIHVKYPSEWLFTLLYGPESPFISHINYTLDILTLCLWFQWVLGTALWLERNVSFRKWDTNHIKNGNINGKMLKLTQLELKKKTKYL